jgi:hypothetical protein
MWSVQIEHPIPDYDRWRAAFDRDPANREASGVRRYRVSRPVDDPNYVIVELDFDDRETAEAFVAKMRGIWKQVEGTVMTGPKARIVESVDEHFYSKRELL